jgi:chemotaxis protein methyltransferase CheR
MTAQSDQAFFEELLKRESGLLLAPEKAALLETRLLPVAGRHGLKGIGGLAAALRKNADAALLSETVEAMAAGDSSFFRDPAVFRFLGDTALPAAVEASPVHLRCWSAGCATGQEAYSAAILLQERGIPGAASEILATDLSRELVDYARTGLYTQIEVQRGLSARRLVTHFTQEGQRWRLRKDIRARVCFERGNLLRAADYPRACDIVFCRNLLAHFDAPTRETTLRALRAALKAGGFLFLGAAETAPAATGFAPAGCAGVFRAA